MRDDQRRQRLVDVNPWWRAASAGVDPTAWAAHQSILRSRRNFDLGYRPNILDDVRVGPITDLLVVLTGPRRIGKSVALLDTAATLCARPDLDPRQIVYLPCDGMNAQDVHRSLILARELTRAIDFDQPKPRVWLLDEISGVSGWTATLKLARDTTPFGNDTVIATGSRWNAQEDVQGNLLAGRAGTTSGRRTRILMPMTFRDFLVNSRRQTPVIGPVHLSEIQSPAVAKALDAFAFDTDSYDLAWRATSPLNITHTAEAVGFPSRAIAERRLNRLVTSQAALWCPRRDGDKLVVGAQAKLYLTDPLLAALPSRLRSGMPPPDLTKLTEMVIGVALARAIDDLEEGRWVSGDTIGYTRTAREGEVDFSPIPIPSASGSVTTVPIESKWVDQGWKSAAKTMDRKFGCGVLATKSVLDVSGPVWAVPAPFLALLLQ